MSYSLMSVDAGKAENDRGEREKISLPFPPRRSIARRPNTSDQYTKILVSILNTHGGCFSSIELLKRGHEISHSDRTK